MTLKKLYQIIEDRKKNMPKDSYVASLFRDGSDRIAQKLGEEAIEVIIAGRGKDKKKKIEEVADLLFHLLIFLSVEEIKLEEIFRELESRNKENGKINS